MFVFISVLADVRIESIATALFEMTVCISFHTGCQERNSVYVWCMMNPFFLLPFLIVTFCTDVKDVTFYDFRYMFSFF